MSPTVTPEVVRKEQKHLAPVMQETPVEGKLSLPVKEILAGVGNDVQLPTPSDDTVDATGDIENGSETKTGKKTRTVTVKRTVKQKKLMAAERRKQYDLLALTLKL